MKEFIIKFSDSDAEKLIEGMPEAKDNRITRCRDCLYFITSYIADGEGFCDMWGADTIANGFCYEGTSESEDEDDDS